MNNQSIQPTVAPGLLKLGACFIYEAITVVAISFACAGVFLWLAGDATPGVKRGLLQLFLWTLVGAYFVRCWLTSGQTLAMQAWSLQLLNKKNQVLGLNEALVRYVLATASLLLCGLGFLWAIVDKDKLFLHDRLLKCRIVSLSRSN